MGYRWWVRIAFTPSSDLDTARTRLPPDVAYQIQSYVFVLTWISLSHPENNHILLAGVNVVGVFLIHLPCWMSWRGGDISAFRPLQWCHVHLRLPRILLHLQYATYPHLPVIESPNLACVRNWNANTWKYLINCVHVLYQSPVSKHPVHVLSPCTVSMPCVHILCPCPTFWILLQTHILTSVLHMMSEWWFLSATHVWPSSQSWWTVLCDSLDRHLDYGEDTPTFGVFLMRKETQWDTVSKIRQSTAKMRWCWYTDIHFQNDWRQLRDWYQSNTHHVDYVGKHNHK